MTTTGEQLNGRITQLEISLATLGATLGTKLDSLISTLTGLQVDHETRLRALEGRPQDSVETEARLTKLERGWYIAAGAAIALGGGAGAVVQAVMPP